MIAFVGVVFESVCDEVLELADRRMRSTGEGIDGLNGAIEVLESSRDVFAKRFSGKRPGLVPSMLRFGIVRGDEEPGKCRLEVRAHVLQKEVVAPEDGRRDDDVGVDCPIAKLEAAGENCAPALGFAAGIFVANQEGSVDFFEEFFERVIGMAPENEANATFLCVLF